MRAAPTTSDSNRYAGSSRWLRCRGPKLRPTLALQCAQRAVFPLPTLPKPPPCYGLEMSAVGAIRHSSLLEQSRILVIFCSGKERRQRRGFSSCCNFTGVGFSCWRGRCRGTRIVIVVPSPNSSVVKKGSKALPRCSSGLPAPVGRTGSELMPTPYGRRCARRVPRQTERGPEPAIEASGTQESMDGSLIGAPLSLGSGARSRIRGLRIPRKGLFYHLSSLHHDLGRHHLVVERSALRAQYRLLPDHGEPRRGNA